jgi:hypothetical protein
MKNVPSGKWHCLIIRKSWEETAVMRFESVSIHNNMSFINSTIPVVAVNKKISLLGPYTM